MAVAGGVPAPVGAAGIVRGGLKPAGQAAQGFADYGEQDGRSGK
ncbi:hypothetical protein [Streptomyces sp. NBC_00038]|nr:hypothetical protein [Streptomyces sp. NBC_00038]MCX5562354.1 hypothetical protein [Streptomyces sp. NBC_00038]